MENFGGALIKGPTQVVFQYWLIAGGIVLATSVGLILWQQHDAEKHGRPVPEPGLPSLGLPAPPAFGSTGGFSLDAGPVKVNQGVTAGGGSQVISAAPTRYVAPRPRRPKQPAAARVNAFGGGSR